MPFFEEAHAGRTELACVQLTTCHRVSARFPVERGYGNRRIVRGIGGAIFRGAGGRRSASEICQRQRPCLRGRRLWACGMVRPNNSNESMSRADVAWRMAVTASLDVLSRSDRVAVSSVVNAACKNQRWASLESRRTLTARSGCCPASHRGRSTCPSGRAHEHMSSEATSVIETHHELLAMLPRVDTHPHRIGHLEL